jgi:light-regulated signal transduction histidine kinase (bacteriophytochrome)
VTLRDITARKEAEAKLRDLNLDLERRVQERTCDLESANQELEAFAYSASHDLRTPLQSIDGWGQALAEDYGDRLDKTGLGYLATIRGEAKRMRQLIDALLQLSRVARSEMSREPVDLSALATEMAATLRQHDPGRAAEIVIAPGLTARGDPVLLRTVLQNLLGNAWKFTAKTAAARIEFGQARRDDGRPAFFVRDNGAGFDRAFAAKLFLPFQRLHRQEEFAGTGIGLSLVKRIITRHGGEVWAEGEVGQGATFWFTLAE